MNTIIYSDNFRTALHSPVALEHEYDLRCAMQALMFELLQNPARKHDANLQGMLTQCRLRLRELQNLVDATRGEHEFVLQSCDLRSLLEDLCAAADLLLSPHGRSVIFIAPHELVENACAPRELTFLVLELIVNALRHTHGEEISVVLQRKARAATITVESMGEINLDELHQHAKRQGSGVSAMLRTAWLHHGTLLWLQRDSKTVAVLKLPLQNKTNAPHYGAPDLVDYLADQCSPVYIGLAQLL